MKYLDFTYESNGFVGHMAMPDTPTKHAVLIVMGGEKSILPGIKIAERFCDYGVAGLSVSLFGAPGIPASPDRVPLEMFLKAVDYLSECGYSHISTYGMSMGSIFASLVGIHDDRIENIILVSPTHVPFEGTNPKGDQMSGHSVVTYQGQELPYVSADFSKYPRKKYLKNSDAGYPVLGMWQSYYEAYRDKEKERHALLPLYKAHANVLMIAGEMDEGWPSAYAVKSLERELAENNYRYEVQSYIYPRIGHLTGMMPNKQREKWLYRMMPVIGFMYKSLGKYKNEHLSAFGDTEHKIIEFIKKGSSK